MLHLPIPNTSALAGAIVYEQGLVAELGSNGLLALTSSNALTLTVARSRRRTEQRAPAAAASSWPPAEPGRAASYRVRPVTAPIDPARADQSAREALAFFEAVLQDRGLLIHVDDDVRRRLLEAAGRVARPDPWQKREFLREAPGGSARNTNAPRTSASCRRPGSASCAREAVFVTPPALRHRWHPATTSMPRCRTGGAARRARRAQLLHLQDHVHDAAPLLRLDVPALAATSTTRSASRPRTCAGAPR